jgi:hypothetical protein
MDTSGDAETVDRQQQTPCPTADHTVFVLCVLVTLLESPNRRDSIRALISCHSPGKRELGSRFWNDTNFS